MYSYLIIDCEPKFSKDQGSKGLEGQGPGVEVRSWGALTNKEKTLTLASFGMRLVITEKLGSLLVHLRLPCTLLTCCDIKSLSKHRVVLH